MPWPRTASGIPRSPARISPDRVLGRGVVVHAGRVAERHTLGHQRELAVVPRELRLHDPRAPAARRAARMVRIVVAVVGHADLDLLGSGGRPRRPRARSPRPRPARPRPAGPWSGSDAITSRPSAAGGTATGRHVPRSSRTRPPASASAQVSAPVARASQVAASVSIDGGRAAARVADAGDGLHGGVRRHPHLDRCGPGRARRAPPGSAWLSSLRSPAVGTSLASASATASGSASADVRACVRPYPGGTSRKHRRASRRGQPLCVTRSTLTVAAAPHTPRGAVLGIWSHSGSRKGTS